jgi:uncharacterized RDD family membrane protein YckC
MVNEGEVVNVGTEKRISGFWRRVLAFIIDLIILEVLGVVLGLLFARQFAALAWGGPFVGLCIAAVYFGILDSRIGKGQSMGKRFVKICVVNREGGFISPKRGIVRGTILAVPVCLNALYLPFLPAVAQGIMGFVFFSITVTLVYFYLFNRNTRQTLHDLATGTFVVKKTAVHEPIRRKIWQKHYLAVSLLVLAIVGGGVYLQFQSAKTGDMSALVQLQTELMKLQGADNASVFVTKQVHLKSGYQVRSLNVTVFTHDSSRDFQNMENAAANIILTKYPQVHEMRIIQVRIVYGYNIGIAKNYQIYATSFSPGNYQKRIQVIGKTFF